MAPDPLVTVVTPTHNRLAFLKETLGSVLAQTITALEYIVVDDGSSDGTWDWLQGQARIDSRIRPIRFVTSQERAAARNAGLEAARGEWICFLDDDDLLDRHALEIHLEALGRHPGAIASIGGYNAFDQHGGRQTFREIRRIRALNVWQTVLFGWVPVSGQWLFHTANIREIGGWEGAHIPIEDHKLLLKLTGLGPVVVCPDIVFNYRVHDGQWRPQDLDGRMTAVRQEIINELPEADRQAAERLMAARSEYNLARQAYWDRRGWPAFGGFLRAIRLEPSLLRSPIGRRMILPLTLKSLAGGPFLKLGGWIRRLLRQAAGHQLEASLQIKETENDAKN